MMRSTSALVLLLTVVASGWGGAVDMPPTAASAGAKPDVSAVLDRFVQVSGGDAALAAVRTLRRTGTLVRGGSGKVPFSAVSEVGRWLYDQTLAYGDVVKYGSDGTSAWVNDAHGTADLPAAERLDLALLLGARAPLELRALYPEMALKEDPGASGAIVVSARSRDGIEIELRFDRQTGFLLQAGDLNFEEYRPEGKLVLPHKVLFGPPLGDDGLRLVLEVTAVTFDEPVDSRVFAPPTCPAASRKAPLFTLRKQVEVGEAAMNACVGSYQHPTDPKVTYTVSRQGRHLMIERTGWGRRFEIKPESELDYFVRFLNWEFHFVRDEVGRVVRLEIGSERKVKAARIS